MESVEKVSVNLKQDKQNTRNKRDISVELLRIMASFIVVGTHVKLTNYILENGAVNKSVLFISNFFGEGVTIFFLILGFFYFNNNSTKKLFKHTFFNLIIPTGIYMVIAQFLYFWIVGEKTFIASIFNPGIGWKNIFTNILQWTSASIRLSPHLWFVFTYVQCILWFPLLRFLKEGENKARKYIIVLALSNLFLIDLQKVVELPFGRVMGFSVIPVYILIVLLGYELYRKKDYIKNNIKIRVGGLCLYFILHLLYFRICLFLLESGSEQRMAWDSMFSIGTAMAIAAFVLSFEFKNPHVQKIIAFIGKNTFYIYLVHWMIIAKLSNTKTLILNKSLELANNGVGELVYTLAFSILIYLISLLIAIIICLIKKYILILHAKIAENVYILIKR